MALVQSRISEQDYSYLLRLAEADADTLSHVVRRIIHEHIAAAQSQPLSLARGHEGRQGRT